MDIVAIDDPIFCAYIELVAAVFRRARRDISNRRNVSREDRLDAERFLSDRGAIEFGLAFTGFPKRRGYDL